MTALIPERLTTGWRGPVLAAAVAMFAGLPTAFNLPLTDRHEARTVQATAQMLESRDFVAINFQDRTRAGEPVGVHWLQALSVSLTSKVEARDLFAYRLPSLLAAMLLAAACAWGAAVFFTPRVAAAAGAIAGASLALSLSAGLATPHACTAAGLVLAMAAFGRIYAQSHGLGRAGPGVRTLLWAGLILAILTGGWIPAATAFVPGLILFVRDGAAPWGRRLAWGWGLIVLGLVVGPWAIAITVATDGGYWSGAAADRVAWTPPGAPSLTAVLLFFPFVALAPMGVVRAWRGRTEPGLRLALAWLAAALLSVELNPARAVDDVLPLLAPLAWLSAAALGADQARTPRRVGAGTSLAAGLILAVLAIALAARYGGRADFAVAAVAALAFIAGGGLAGWAVLRPERTKALFIAAAIGLCANGLLIGGLAPRLEALWPSQRTVAALERLGLHPRDGLVQGPVTVAGYAEPSLIFALGAQTIVGDGRAAAQAIAEGRPAIVEAGQELAFSKALESAGVGAQPVATTAGLDYADGEPVRLTIWRSAK